MRFCTRSGPAKDQKEASVWEKIPLILRKSEDLSAWWFFAGQCGWSAETSGHEWS